MVKYKGEWKESFTYKAKTNKFPYDSRCVHFELPTLV